MKAGTVQQTAAKNVNVQFDSKRLGKTIKAFTKWVIRQANMK